MDILLGITAPVFLLIGLGYVLARKNFFPENTQRAFNLYAFYCAMPCYYFQAMAKVPRNMLGTVDYIAAFALSMFLVALIGGLVAKYAGRDFTSCVLATMSACHTNSGLIGLPIIIMAYGNVAPVIIVSLFQTIFITTTILTSIEIHKRHGGLSWKALSELPKTIALNPIIGAALIGIVFSLENWAIPAIIGHTTELLGGAGIPTSLVALGLSLGSEKIQFEAQDRVLVYILTALKIFIHPICAWLIARYVFKLVDPWLGSLTIVSAMPTAINNFIFAQRYNNFVFESKQIVSLTLVFSIFTVTWLLWFFNVHGPR